MRMVNSANLELDKAEEQIRTGRAEFAPAKLKGAQASYDQIFQYFQGRFDPEDPTLVQLKNRIATVHSHFPGKAWQQSPSSVSSAIISLQKPLFANIQRYIDSADRQLVWVNQQAAKGERDSNALEKAKTEYQNIFTYFKGRFAPNHPDIIALKNRIDAAEQAMIKGVVRKNTSAPLETNPAAVSDLPPKMGADLRNIAATLFTLENRLKTATASTSPGSYVAGVKHDLDLAASRFEQFNSEYKGQFSSTHVAYMQVKNRLEVGRRAFAKLQTDAGAASQATSSAERAVDSARAQQIRSKYSERPINSRLYKNNPDHIIWFDKEIAFGIQDQITPKTSFKLTDPIFARVFVKNSLGNTPVYGSSNRAHIVDRLVG